MQYSTNFEMNKPERADQYNVDHWNDNTDIIDSEMQAIRSGTDDVMKETLLNFCYPIGSLYWSSKSTNPSTLFGGTWTQIKDRFIWAKGDSDTVNATGGAKTVTLTVDNLPSHTHSFTPSGSVSSHSHGLNNHTHSFTPSGSVSSHSHTMTHDHTVSISGITGKESEHESFWWSGSHNHTSYVTQATQSNSATEGYYCQARDFKATYGSTTSDTTITVSGTCSGDHTHNFSGSGSTSSFQGSTGSTQPTFTGTAGTTGGNSGNTTSVQPTFTGTAGTTGGTGSGTSVDKMPPYIVKYCWERIA